MNRIITPITPDGRTGFDQYKQLMTWTVPDADGYQRGHMIRDVRACTCYICGKGWGNTTDELVDQDQIYDQDVHKSCLSGYRKIAEYQLLQRVLIEAGFLFRREEVPPRYPNSTPWQRVTVLRNDPERTDSGYRIVLGSRKRVWELRVHKVGDLREKFNHLVNNTMGFNHQSEDEPEFGEYFFIHAWSEKEMVDFLKVFHSSIPDSISRDV